MSAGDTKAGEYAIGVLDSETREALARAADSDKALSDEIAWWQAKLAPLSMSKDERPAAGTLDRIMSRIEVADVAEVPALPGTVTLRAQDGAWEKRDDLGRGVERKMLWSDAASGREAFLIRLAPGGTVNWHPHPADEECYVIEGDLSFGPLRLIFIWPSAESRILRPNRKRAPCS
jgi:hypothetical protein